MGKSKKRKKKTDSKQHAMSSKRMAAVDRIERARRREPAAAATPAKPVAKTPARTDPKAAPLIAEARRLGLSVADDADAARVEQLLEQFAVAARYVDGVWEIETGQSPAERTVSTERLNRFVAGLFSDGRVADAVIDAQQRRGDNPPPRDATRKRVATRLRGQFGDILPKRSLLGRLFGGNR